MKRIGPRLLMLTALCSICMLVSVEEATAESTYPSRPIRLIVPFSPGGGADSLARPLAEGLSKQLDQPVIVENRSGAGSNIGTAIVAEANPDGYTLLLNTDAIAVYPFLYSDLKYDWKRQLTAVTYVAKSPLVLAINKDVPAQNLNELVELARRSPDALNFANPGQGSPHHLGFELLLRDAGIGMTQITYRGGGPSLIDVLGGHVQVGVFTFGAVQSYLGKGSLKPLALLTRERSTALAPTLPTAVELGYENVHADLSFVMMAPSGTPPEIVAKIQQATEAVVRQPSFTELLHGLGYEPFVMSSEKANQILDEESVRWKPIISELNIEVF